MIYPRNFIYHINVSDYKYMIKLQ
uniref:Uncharacterized protein n=1 Tax=Anguilla anguilla TaxID=7936 RepID=A0A0E9S7L5_ANGAN